MGAFYRSTHTQLLAQQPNWVVNNSIVNPTTGQVKPNPFASTPNHTQNAIWDANGDLQFYAEDGKIFNSIGQQIMPYSWGPNTINPNVNGHSEFTFVPIPDECNKWYAFTIDKLNDVSFAQSLIGNLHAQILNFCILDGSLNQGGGVE